jgi:hypothetical protein
MSDKGRSARKLELENIFKKRGYKKSVNATHRNIQIQSHHYYDYILLLI